MPNYEYQCTKCRRRVELTHAVGAKPGKCPTCGGTLRRVYSSVGVVFKGSGFYKTDYRKSPGATDGEGSSKPAGESVKATKDAAPKATTSETTKGSPTGGKAD